MLHSQLLRETDSALRTEEKVEQPLNPIGTYMLNPSSELFGTLFVPVVCPEQTRPAIFAERRVWLDDRFPTVASTQVSLLGADILLTGLLHTAPSLSDSVYTMLDPAPGSDGKECMVLTTTQNLSGAAESLLGQPAFMGVSLSLSTVKYLEHNVGWMSKRLVLLIADEDFQGAERLDLGVKTFIDDYHTDTLDLLER